jgi:hypothetical protein
LPAFNASLKQVVAVPGQLLGHASADAADAGQLLVQSAELARHAERAARNVSWQAIEHCLAAAPDPQP